MTTNSWKEQVGSMIFLKREFGILLHRIASSFERTGEEFDEYFRHEFFEMTNSELFQTYSIFLTNRLRKRIEKYSILNDGNDMKQNMKMEENESSMYDENPSTLMDQCLTIDQSFEQNETAQEESADSVENDSVSSFGINENVEHINVNSIEFTKENEHSIDDEYKILKRFDINDDNVNEESETNVNDTNEETRTKNVPISPEPSTSFTTRTNDNKSFICHECPNEFPTLCMLNNHKRIHRGEKPLKTYKCDECFIEFIYSSNLTKHKRTHTGERPFVCDVCARAFSTLATLNNHKVIHTGEKPFECGVCSKKFALKNLLRHHERVIHAGIRPHKCDICLKGFSNSSHLKSHLFTHSKKTFKCDNCSEEFSRIDRLKFHKCVRAENNP